KLTRMHICMDTKYDYIKTVFDIPKEELMLKYTNYLIDAGIKVKRINKKTNSTHVTAVVSLMSIFYDYIYDVFDQTPEYVKDFWDGKKLPIELKFNNTGTKKKKYLKEIHVTKYLHKKYIISLIK